MFVYYGVFNLQISYFLSFLHEFFVSHNPIVPLPLTYLMRNCQIFINRLFSFTEIKPVLSIFVKIPLIMETTVANRLELLTERLNDADRKSILLQLEVTSIRAEIADLQQKLTATNTFSAPTGSHVKKGTILLDYLPSSNSVDGPTSNKRSHTDDDLSNAKKTRNAFMKENDYVLVYTDGACENNGRPNARAGIGVWFGDRHPLNISKPVVGKATNNTAEIQACVQALKAIKEQGENKAKILTDSQFTINCMTNWIRRWKTNDWKTASGGAVKNKEDLQVLDKLISTFGDVQWEHVAGHNGIKGNEEADKLAREGALRYRTIKES